MLTVELCGIYIIAEAAFIFNVRTTHNWEWQFRFAIWSSLFILFSSHVGQMQMFNNETHALLDYFLFCTISRSMAIFTFHIRTYFNFKRDHPLFRARTRTYTHKHSYSSTHTAVHFAAVDILIVVIFIVKNVFFYLSSSPLELSVNYIPIQLIWISKFMYPVRIHCVFGC